MAKRKIDFTSAIQEDKMKIHNTGVNQSGRPEVEANLRQDKRVQFYISQRDLDKFEELMSNSRYRNFNEFAKDLALKELYKNNN